MVRACHDTHSVWMRRQLHEDSTNSLWESATGAAAALDSASVMVSQIKSEGNFNLRSGNHNSSYSGELKTVPPSCTGPQYAVLSQIPCRICTFPHHPGWGRTLNIETSKTISLFLLDAMLVFRFFPLYAGLSGKKLMSHTFEHQSRFQNLMLSAVVGLFGHCQSNIINPHPICNK